MPSSKPKDKHTFPFFSGTGEGATGSDQHSITGFRVKNPCLEQVPLLLGQGKQMVRDRNQGAAAEIMIRKDPWRSIRRTFCRGSKR